MGCISSNPSRGKSQTITPGLQGGAGGTLRQGDSTALHDLSGLLKLFAAGYKVQHSRSLTEAGIAKDHMGL